MELSKKGLRRSCSPVPTPGSPSSGPGLEPELSLDTSGRMDSFISKSRGHGLPASCPVFGLLSALLHRDMGRWEEERDGAQG